MKTAKQTTINKLNIGDSILDNDGLELVVKNIIPRGNKTEITVNYKESGFYRCNDTTKLYSNNTKVMTV